MMKKLKGVLLVALLAVTVLFVTTGCEPKREELKFEGDEDPVGIYTYEDELFVLTGDGWDLHIGKFDEETINEIYNQVCK